jgi:PII-like signaling protein
MLQAGKAMKVSIYLSEGSRHHSTADEGTILDFLLHHGVAGASVFKDHHVHTVSSVDLSDHLPVKVEFIETREKVDELMAKLIELAGTGMIEVQETVIVKPASVVE